MISHTFQASRRLCAALLLALPLVWMAPAHAATAESDAEAWVARIKSGGLLSLSDEALIAAFSQLHPQAIPAYLQLGVQPFNEYEMWMRREERLADGWTRKPFLNHIKYRHQPRQIYVKWLKDSPKAGQEIIYDETRRKDAMLGHAGGLFNITSVWTALDGALARGNSNHSIRDLGVQFIVDTIVRENSQRAAAGLPTAPARIEVASFQGERCVALTWMAAPGLGKGYAHRVKVLVDLRQPLVRQIEAWDAAGEMLERIALERIVPARFDEDTFNPKNPAYDF